MRLSSALGELVGRGAAGPWPLYQSQCLCVGLRTSGATGCQHRTYTRTMNSVPTLLRSYGCTPQPSALYRRHSHPSPPCRRVLPLVSLAVLACIVYVGYKLYYAPFMRHQALYAVGALCIYWFSVSGERAAQRGWAQERVNLPVVQAHCFCRRSPGDAAGVRSEAHRVCRTRRRAACRRRSKGGCEFLLLTGQPLCLRTRPPPPAGGMFNIIRGVPLVGFDHRKRQAMLFMQGQGEIWLWTLVA